jgi:hypothetical protein
MWVTPDSGSRRKLQRVSRDDVVVREPVNDHQRTLQRGCQWDQRVAVVDVGLRVGVAEIALGVARVVEAPLGHGRAGDGRVEHVGTAEYGKRGEVAAIRPSRDPDARGVHIVGEGLGDSSEGVDLVVQSDSGEVVLHRAFEVMTATGCAAAVRDDHAEALVGEPLRFEEGAR